MTATHARSDFPDPCDEIAFVRYALFDARTPAAVAALAPGLREIARRRVRGREAFTQAAKLCDWVELGAHTPEMLKAVRYTIKLAYL